MTATHCHLHRPPVELEPDGCPECARLAPPTCSLHDEDLDEHTGLCWNCLAEEACAVERDEHGRIVTLCEDTDSFVEWCRDGSDLTPGDIVDMLRHDLDSLLEKWRWKAEQSLRSTPRAADLDGDGSAEVIVGCDSARLYVLDGRTGLARWHYAAGDKVQGEAAVVDLTGDGLPELIFGAQDGRVTAVSLSSR